MGLANQTELAPKGLIRLVIYPREAEIRAASKPLGQGVPWISSALIFLLSAALTFAGVYAHEMWSPGNLTGAQSPQSVSSVSNLGLQVQYEGERLLVTWNRGSLAARSAVQGVLRIDDGGQHHDVVMDATQIVAGSVLYKPVSGDVSFRFEVENDRGAAVVESIRVLDAGKPQPGVAPPQQPQSNSPATGSPPPQARAQTRGPSRAAPIRALALNLRPSISFC